MAAPRDQRLLCIVIIGEIVFRHLNGQACVFIAEVFLFRVSASYSEWPVINT